MADAIFFAFGKMLSNVYFFSALVLVTISACIAFSGGKPAETREPSDGPGTPVFDRIRSLAQRATEVPAYTVVPLTPGYDRLTPAMARGGNAGYLHPDTSAIGGWIRFDD